MTTAILLAISICCIPLSFVLLCREWRRGTSNLPAATARQIANARRVGRPDLSELWERAALEESRSREQEIRHAVDTAARWVPPATGDFDTPDIDTDHGGN